MDKLTKKQIVSLCEKHGITGVKSLTKKEIIKVLEDNRETLEGSGIFQDIGSFFKKGAQRIAKIFSPNLDSYNNVSKRTLKKYGNLPIVNLAVYRTPLSSFLNTVLSVLSFGKIDSLKKKYGYDKLYHLALIATVKDTKGVMRNIVIEKEENPTISEKYKASDLTESEGVNLRGKNLTLNEMLEKTRQHLGNQKYFSYNAFSLNCQHFIAKILTINGLLTPKLKRFIYQSMKELRKELPPGFEKLAKTITDIGGVVAKLTGKGDDEEKEGAGKGDKKTKAERKKEEKEAAKALKKAIKKGTKEAKKRSKKRTRKSRKKSAAPAAAAAASAAPAEEEIEISAVPAAAAAAPEEEPEEIRFHAVIPDEFSDDAILKAVDTLQKLQERVGAPVMSDEEAIKFVMRNLTRKGRGKVLRGSGRRKDLFEKLDELIKLETKEKASIEDLREDLATQSPADANKLAFDNKGKLEELYLKMNQIRLDLYQTAKELLTSRYYPTESDDPPITDKLAKKLTELTDNITFIPKKFLDINPPKGQKVKEALKQREKEIEKEIEQVEPEEPGSPTLEIPPLMIEDLMPAGDDFISPLSPGLRGVLASTEPGRGEPELLSSEIPAGLAQDISRTVAPRVSSASASASASSAEVPEVDRRPGLPRIREREDEDEDEDRGVRARPTEEDPTGGRKTGTKPVLSKKTRIAVLDRISNEIERTTNKAELLFSVLNRYRGEGDLSTKEEYNQLLKEYIEALDKQLSLAREFVEKARKELPEVDDDTRFRLQETIEAALPTIASLETWKVNTRPSLVEKYSLMRENIRLRRERERIEQERQFAEEVAAAASASSAEVPEVERRPELPSTTRLQTLDRFVRRRRRREDEDERGVRARPTEEDEEDEEAEGFGRLTGGSRIRRIRLIIKDSEETAQKLKVEIKKILDFVAEKRLTPESIPRIIADRLNRLLDTLRKVDSNLIKFYKDFQSAEAAEGRTSPSEEAKEYIKRIGDILKKKAEREVAVAVDSGVDPRPAQRKLKELEEAEAAKAKLKRGKRVRDEAEAVSSLKKLKETSEAAETLAELKEAPKRKAAEALTKLKGSGSGRLIGGLKLTPEEIIEGALALALYSRGDASTIAIIRDRLTSGFYSDGSIGLGDEKRYPGTVMNEDGEQVIPLGDDEEDAKENSEKIAVQFDKILSELSNEELQEGFDNLPDFVGEGSGFFEDFGKGFMKGLRAVTGVAKTVLPFVAPGVGSLASAGLSAVGLGKKIKKILKKSNLKKLKKADLKKAFKGMNIKVGGAKRTQLKELLAKHSDSLKEHPEVVDELFKIVS